jgi:hypothetical protein
MTDPGDYDGWTISIDAQWQKVTVRIPTEGTTEHLLASISSTSIIVYSIRRFERHADIKNPSHKCLIRIRAQAR